MTSPATVKRAAATMAAAALLLVGDGLSPAAAQEAARPSFSEWLAGVRADAIARGIRDEVVDAALAGVEEPLPVILERDRTQAETIFSLDTYIARRLTPKLITSGRDAFAANRELLAEVGGTYGVPPRIIAAIWGIESNYGRFSGVRPTVAALATLAWDPRRATFFRGELMNALEILNRGDIELSHLRGSWAGAMGQTQFMPSSYLQFAEDYDGDGRRDIWSTPADVFASIANYLKGRGWTGGPMWGREVGVGDNAASRIRADLAPRTGGCQAIRNMTIAQPVAKWTELGVTLPNGRPLPSDLPDTSMVSGTTRHFLVTANYDAILDYNCSNSYAITVALLGDAIASSGKIAAQPAPKKKGAAARKSTARKKRSGD